MSKSLHTWLTKSFTWSYFRKLDNKSYYYAGIILDAFCSLKRSKCWHNWQRPRDEDEWRDCCSLHAVTSSVIYYSTHTRKNVIYLFYTIQIQLAYWSILGAWKKKNKSADVIWRGFDAICVSLASIHENAHRSHDIV